MSFISTEFACLFVLCFAACYLVGQRFRKAVLLASSCIFIGYFHVGFLLVAVAVALFAYGAGILIEKTADRPGRQQAAFWGACLCLVLCWTGFRYAGKLTGTSILFPLGISFYTFQALAYLTEVYWGEEKAERNVTDFLLYMLLFLKFLSGPIERPGNLLAQVKELRPATYPMMTYGAKLILVGLIKKLMIADHLGPYIDHVFASVHEASGVQLLMAALLYPVELYADFSGYTDMAVGGALLFGLRLSPNLDRPFTSQTTAEFWRRWHISLSSWVRDYLYLPLASVVRGWGQWGIAGSLLVTFVALGVWHGAGWTFVVYGLIQGIVIVWEQRTAKARNALRDRLGNRLFTLLSQVRTYLVFALSLIFFKAQTLEEAFYYIGHLSFRVHSSWKEVSIGIPDRSCIVAGATLLLLLVYEHFMARGDVLQRLERQPAALRWTLYYLFVFVLFAYGKFGTENFIYLQF